MGVLISNFDAGEMRFNKRRNSVFRYLASQNLPTELRARAFNFFEYTWARTKGVEVQEVVTDFNTALSTDVMSHICSDAVKNVPVFREKGEAFLSSIVQVLSFQAFPQGEWLMRRGTIGREMFFILKGEVDIIVDEQLMFVIKTLQVGEFVGEGALFQDQGKRGSSVRARTSCETMVLSKDGFSHVLETYPDIEQELLDASNKRRQDTESVVKALERRMPTAAGSGRMGVRRNSCGDLRIGARPFPIKRSDSSMRAAALAVACAVHKADPQNGDDSSASAPAAAPAAGGIKLSPIKGAPPALAAIAVPKWRSSPDTGRVKWPDVTPAVAPRRGRRTSCSGVVACARGKERLGSSNGGAAAGQGGAPAGPGQLTRPRRGSCSLEVLGIAGAAAREEGPPVRRTSSARNLLSRSSETLISRLSGRS